MRQNNKLPDNAGNSREMDNKKTTVNTEGKQRREDNLKPDKTGKKQVGDNTPKKTPKDKKMKTPKTPIKKRKKKALSKPDVFKEFVVWMSIPAPLKTLKTQGDFAKQFGVSPDTLSDWKKRPLFWKEVEGEWNRWGREKTGKIINEFYKKILREGTTPDFKLWFQFFLKWSEKIEQKLEGELVIIHKWADKKKK